MKLPKARALTVPAELPNGAPNCASDVARADAHLAGGLGGGVLFASDAEAQAQSTAFTFGQDLVVQNVFHELGKLVPAEGLFRCLFESEQAGPTRIFHRLLVGDRHLVGDPYLHPAPEALDEIRHEDLVNLRETLLHTFLFFHSPSLADGLKHCDAEPISSNENYERKIYKSQQKFKFS